mgnify:CR=1 FL=1
MADLPNLHQPAAPRGDTTAAAAGQPIAEGFGGTDAPTHPDAQATDPGTPPRFSQPTQMSAEDTTGEMG